MKEDAISSSGDPTRIPKASSSPAPPTPAASSAGASSPAAATNAGSTEWLGNAQGSKGGSFSRVGSQPLRNSFSTSAGGSALGSSYSSCRPWERGDLLVRLSTFTPSNWFGKPKDGSSLACARRGWLSVGVDKIVCECCGANLIYTVSGDDYEEDFAKKLDGAHKITCPWRGSVCADSLVQFPPTPPSALIGGFKDRCDGLLQFFYLPSVAASTLKKMKVSRGPEIERFLVQSQTLTFGESGFKAEIMSVVEEASCSYSRALKLISLCGWEPRWLPNIQDYEEHSAQSARNGYSIGDPLQDRAASKNALSASNNKDSRNEKKSGPSLKCESRLPMLDCSLCGATVRVMDFIPVIRPASLAPTNNDVTETSKKMALTRGVSSASGISGWVATGGMEKEQTEDLDEAATAGERKPQSNMGLDLNLTMGGGLPNVHLDRYAVSQKFQETSIGRDLIIGQPSSSEVGDRAASYESRGPSTRKRTFDEGGSTVDRPPLMNRPVDSVEGIVIDRDGDEVDDSKGYSAGPSKRACEPSDFETYNSSYWRDSSGAGPSQTLLFDIERDAPFFSRSQGQATGFPSTRDSTRASSVIAMDTVCHTVDGDSMDSVENFPGDTDDINFPSTSTLKNPDLNEASELNFSNQAQHSTCPDVERVGGEIGISSTNDEDEVLNADTATGHGRDGLSFGISGGSVGMGASHEAEIHGVDVSVHRVDSGIGDVELVAEVTENQGQTGEFAPDPGLMGDHVPELMERGESQYLMSRTVFRADSGSKIVDSVKAESVESGEKTSDMNVLPHEHSTHLSLSCNAVVCSGFEASKEEVSQGGKASPTDECGYPVSGSLVANGIGPPNGSNFEEAAEFDPIKHHNVYCPWVNANVAAAGCSSSSIGSSSSAGAGAFCGWQLTLDALDAFQSRGHLPNETVESESAASQYKDDDDIRDRKLKERRSFNKSRGQT